MGGEDLRDFVCGIVIVIKWSGLFISETAESAGKKEKEKIQFSGWKHLVDGKAQRMAGLLWAYR